MDPKLRELERLAQAGDLEAAHRLWRQGQRSGDADAQVAAELLMGWRAELAQRVQDAWQAKAWAGVESICAGLGFALDRAAAKELTRILKAAHYRRTRRRFAIADLIAILADARTGESTELFRHAGDSGSGRNWATTAALAVRDDEALTLGVARCGWPIMTSRAGWPGLGNRQAYLQWAASPAEDRLRLPLLPSRLRPKRWEPVGEEAAAYLEKLETELRKQEAYRVSVFLKKEHAPSEAVREQALARIREAYATWPAEQRYTLLYDRPPPAWQHQALHSVSLRINDAPAGLAKHGDSAWLQRVPELSLGTRSLEADDDVEALVDAAVALAAGITGLEALALDLAPEWSITFSRLAANAQLCARIRSLELHVSSYKTEPLPVATWRVLVEACPNLRALRLHRVVLSGPEEEAEFRAVLGSCRKLESLDLDCHGAELPLQPILEALQGAPLRRLILDYVRVGAMTPARPFTTLEELKHEGEVGDPAGLFGWFAGSTLRSLNLRTPITAERARALASAECLQELTHLDLGSCAVDVEAWTELRGAFPALRSLRLNSSKLGEAQAVAVALAGFLPALEELDVSYCGLTPAGVRALFAEHDAYALRKLDLSRNGEWEGDDMLVALAATPLPRTLEDLDASSLVRTGGKGVKALIDAGCPRLRRLSLESIKLGVTGARALADWPGAAQLEHLDLRSTSIPKKGRELLRASPHVRAAAVKGIEDLEGWK